MGSLLMGGRVCILKLRLYWSEIYLSYRCTQGQNIESQCEAFVEEVEVALRKAALSEYLVLLGILMLM